MAVKISRIKCRVIQDKKESLVRKVKGKARKRIKAKRSLRFQKVASSAAKDSITAILVK